MSDNLDFINEHILILLSIHLILSIVLSLLISFYALHRFIKSSKKIDQQDKHKLENIQDRGFLYRVLYKASLHKNNQINIFLFAFLFNLTMPVLGYFFTIWIFWYLINVKYAEKIIDTNILDLDEFKESFLEVQRYFGEGSMINTINNEYIPKSKKIKALSTLALTNSPMSIQVVKQALASKDEEIRLFGYTILNRTETNISSSINKNLSIISDESSKGDSRNEEKIAFASKELAQLYWEMVYTELANESLTANFLNSVVTYAEIAKDYYMPQLDKVVNKIKIDEREENIIDELKLIKEDRKEIDELYAILGNIFSLLGRVYMHRKEYDKAKAEFTIAKELLAKHSTFLVPYLAELHFIEQDYNKVRDLLQDVEELSYNVKLNPIITQWTEAS